MPVKETDLFAPVRELFLAQGFTVNAEVNRCDLVATREDEVVVVELKSALNLSLLAQAVDRQSITRDVFVAVPHPARRNRQFRAREDIIQRLGLGLITVYRSPLRQIAQQQFAPEYDGEIDESRRGKLLKEIAGRSVDNNIGGSSGVKVYTAYRETAVTIGLLLEERGPTRVRDLRPLAGDKTQSILASNHYGWFNRVEIGTYELSDEGRLALDDYPDLRALYANREDGEGSP